MHLSSKEIRLFAPIIVQSENIVKVTKKSKKFDFFLLFSNKTVTVKVLIEQQNYKILHNKGHHGRPATSGRFQHPPGGAIALQGRPKIKEKIKSFFRYFIYINQ